MNQADPHNSKSRDDGAILVAVDFSEDSRAALLWAAKQAELENAPLLILHVVHDPAASPGFYRKPDADWLRPMADVAGDMMKSFVDDEKSGHPELPALYSATTKLVRGLPSGRVVEVAREIGARLVVVGSCGRTGLESILLGSVAERVVQLSPVPVVVVKPPRSGS